MKSFKLLKLFLILTFAGLLCAQSTNLNQAASSITAAQAEFQALQSQLAASQAQLTQYKADHDFGQALDAVCPTCRATITNLLTGKAAGTMEGVVICCGASTVPDAPSNTLLLYIYPTPVPASQPTGQPAQ